MNPPKKNQRFLGKMTMFSMTPAPGSDQFRHDGGSPPPREDGSQRRGLRFGAAVGSCDFLVI